MSEGVDIRAVALRAVAEAAYHRNEALRLQAIVFAREDRIREIEQQLADHKTGHEAIVAGHVEENARLRAVVRQQGLDALNGEVNG